MRIATTSLILATAGAIALAGACSSTQNQGPADASAPDAAMVSEAASPVDAALPLPPLETSDPAIIAPGKRLDNASSPVIFDRERGNVWTANGDVGSVSYVDITAGKLVAEVPVGTNITSVALSPDAKWIAAVDRGGAQVVLIDAESRIVVRAIPLGNHPRAAVWDSANPRWLYVSVEDDNAIAIVDRVAGAQLLEIPVGRLPAGLAVSATRREVYVTHRIDAKVSIVDLASRALSTDLPVAIEPANSDPAVPQGTPFGFESLAWQADGNVAWLPHELLAPTHPFQFQKTLFPALSLLDLDARQEVVTDPNNPAAVIAGRKNLFAAIKIIDSTGNPSVLSQPCAAAMHPNGLVGYAIACASEDLIVFDLTAGIAVDLLRNLPGDHPMGITLDDTGQRAWILSDQSKTLQMVDLASGNLTEHVTLVGAPIALVAKDSVDPALRAGLTLWFRANSSKGAFATTGNNWMSCGGCHLDGLVSTNELFFDVLTPVDSTKDAQIGHIGLKDHFSTAPTPTDPSFDAHDVAVALLDQGGLAPDRTGAHRDHQVDPNAPPAAVVTMAAQISTAIKRDLPLGPSWLLPPGDMPNTAYDTSWCGNCHQPQYAAWQKSVHAHAGEDPMVLHGVTVEQKIQGPQYSRLCAGCHQPVQARLGDTAFSTKNGITCLGCHDTTRLIAAGGNADSETRAHDWTKDHKAWGLASLETLRKPEFCGTCHQQFVPATGLEAITTLSEHQHSPAVVSGPSSRCVDCHMGLDANGVADHSAPGGNVYMGMLFGDANLVAAQKAHLQQAMVIVSATKTGSSVAIAIKNRGAGHSFPTGVTDIREPWIEVQAVDAQNNVVARYGGPDVTTNLLPLTAARLGIDIAEPDGTLLYEHQLSETTRIPYDFRVLAQATQNATITVPAALPAGADHFDALLIYRNVRTQYFQAATGDRSSSPDVEVARVTVQ